jgi:hypothetical protein
MDSVRWINPSFCLCRISNEIINDGIFSDRIRHVSNERLISFRKLRSTIPRFA